jgi:LysR family transcriptional regulator, glycine cleavage system transcriptional activator
MSFKAAAAELGVTPTAVSHQIRELEEACGCALFRRRPRPLALTQAGASLFPVLCAGFDSFAAILEGLPGEAVPAQRRPLRVTTTNAFAHLWLVPRLPLLRATQPGLALEVIGTDAALDLVKGEADLAIRYARRPPAGLAVQELLHDWYWPMCSPTLLPDSRPARCPGDLLRHTLVHVWWDEQVGDVPNWPRWLGAARRLDPGLRPAAAGAAGALHFREELHAIEALVAGQGIGLCSDVLAARELASGALVKAFDLSLPGFGFYLAHLPGHPRQEEIEAFCTWAHSATAGS